MSNTCVNPECVGERIALKVISETLRETRKPPHDCAATLRARLRDTTLVEEMTFTIFHASFPPGMAVETARLLWTEHDGEDYYHAIARAALAKVSEMLKEATDAD